MRCEAGTSHALTFTSTKCAAGSSNFIWNWQRKGELPEQRLREPFECFLNLQTRMTFSGKRCLRELDRNQLTTKRLYSTSEA